MIIPFIPEPLIDDIAQGLCLPFIGAGFSKNALTNDGMILPDWGELTAELASRLPDETGELTGAEVAQLYEERYGRVRLLQAIINELQRTAPRPGNVHQALTRLPFDIIYTTNFDRLIERAYEEINPSVIVIADDLTMPFVGGPHALSVIKMHGDMDHRDRIVATISDYERYLESHPVMATHLSAMFITRTFLFIGYSLSDPNVTSINRIIRDRLGHFKRRSYWIGFDIGDSNPPDLAGEKVNVISISTTQGDNEQYSKSDLLLAVLNLIADRVDEKLNPSPKSLPLLSIRGRGFL